LAFRQKFLTSLQFFLGALAVVDVGQQAKPADDSTFRVTLRDDASLKPAVNTISTTEAMNDVPRLTGFDRMSEARDHLGQISWMDDIHGHPTFQILSCRAEVIQGLLIEKLDFARCSCGRYETRNAIDHLPPGAFARSQSLLRLFQVIDVGIDPTPADEVGLLIVDRRRSDPEPAIRSVEAAKALLRRASFLGLPNILPPDLELWDIFRMHNRFPLPPEQLLRRKPGVI
jgi:hypothetical protein